MGRLARVSPGDWWRERENMITEQFYIRVDYEPATDRRGMIKHYDAVIDRIMSIDNRVICCGGTPASSPYIECTVDTRKTAEHIDKVIQDILTQYKYRVL